jgi:hypothetical protein
MNELKYMYDIITDEKLSTGEALDELIYHMTDSVLFVNELSEHKRNIFDMIMLDNDEYSDDDVEDMIIKYLEERMEENQI